MEITSDHLVALTKLVKEQTHKLRKLNRVERSEDAQIVQIENLIASSDFGCQKKSVARLVSLILDKPIEIISSSTKLNISEEFGCVKYIQKSRYHDTICYLTVGDGDKLYNDNVDNRRTIAVSTNGSARMKDYTRIATDEEIDEFMQSRSEVWLLGVFGKVLSYYNFFKAKTNE